MKAYYLVFVDEFGNKEKQSFETNDPAKAMFEARDLQRILNSEKKESGAYYAIYKRGEMGESDGLFFMAKGN